MIPILAVSLVAIVLLLTLMQTLLVINYHRFHRDSASVESELADIVQLPKAAIILCLRGYEDSTPDCIAELIGQNYPEFEIHIAFDSKNDPAVEQAGGFVEKTNVKAHYFEPLPECSYKCSGIVHVLKQLGGDIEYVAFCDGDAIVDQNWLQDLVMPMIADSKIGATTGNRWFAPVDDGIGSMVRKHWNAAAVVQMQAYDIAWGGSMAVRRSAIEKCELQKHWSRSFCEDTLLTRKLKKQGMQLHRVPNLVIENRETTRLNECLHWISRQLLTVRLHHPGWILVLAHGVATGLSTIVAPIAAILLFAFGYFYEGRSVLVIWGIYQVLNYALLRVIEHCNQAAIKQRQASEHSQPVASRGTGGALGLIGVQLLYPFTVLKTLLMRTVVWRGVTYAVGGNRVRVKRAL